MVIVVRMPSGRIAEYEFDTEDSAQIFKEDLRKLGITSVIVKQQ